MIDIHEFYDFNLTELADGKIFDVLTGIEHQSKLGLGNWILGTVNFDFEHFQMQIQVNFSR